MVQIINIRLTGADAALFMDAKARFGLSRMANLPSLLFLLEKAVASLPAARDSDKPKKPKPDYWNLILPVLNHPNLNPYWVSRKDALHSHVTAIELVEGESARSHDKRLAKAEQFYEDYVAWQEGEDSFGGADFDPNTDQKVLCNAS